MHYAALFRQTEQTEEQSLTISDHKTTSYQDKVLKHDRLFTEPLQQ